MIERFFRVRERGSTPGREALGGLITFLTMAYILFVNPMFLEQAGIPREGAILATAAGAALGTLLMAFLANLPIALAPGMGLNAFFAFGLCGRAGIPWPTALGLVFWSGIAFFILTVTGARKAIIRAVPPVIKLSASVGIGLFIAFIGLQQGGVVVEHPATMVTLGDLTGPVAVITIGGLAFTLVLVAAKIRTAIFWGMLVSLALGLFSGLVPPPTVVASLPRLDFPGLQIDLWGALRLEYMPLLLVLLFFDLFDTLGTLVGVAQAGGLLVNGEVPRIGRALAADATATVAGALFGTSTVTSYIESGTGVGVGARTGLASVVTGLLFVAAVFFTPLAAVVAAGVGGLNPVTAPALIVVGTLMTRAVAEIRWDDMTEAVPALLTAVLMPLAYNISHGLAVGIVAYALVKTAAGRWREVHALMYVLAGLFVLRYALLPI